MSRQMVYFTSNNRKAHSTNKDAIITKILNMYLISLEKTTV